MGAADEAEAELALMQTRIAELDAEVKQLRPAGALKDALQKRVGDRDDQLKRLKAEVCRTATCLQSTPRRALHSMTWPAHACASH